VLFRSRFHKGIGDGSVTRTVRDWSRPQAKVGGRYTVGGTVIEVTGMRQTPVAELSADDAKRGGFESLDGLRAELDRTARAQLPPEHIVWVIDFQAVGVAAPRPEVAVTPEAIAAARRKLAAMDARAPAPWTARFLALIGERPGVVSKVLAGEAGMERLAFKADVRKLKALGLTNSLGTGYELTALGRAVADGR
jgi:hypothetical protein